MSEKDEKLNKGSFLYINDEEKAEWGYPEEYPRKEVVTIEWDGNTAGKAHFDIAGYSYYKVSDLYFDKGDLIYYYGSLADGNQIGSIQVAEQGVMWGDSIVWFVGSPTTIDDPINHGETISVPEAGLYVYGNETNYLKNLTISYAKKIASEFLPDGYPRKERCIIEWDGTTDGRASFKIKERTYYKVSELTPNLDGAKYKVTSPLVDSEGTLKIVNVSGGAFEYTDTRNIDLILAIVVNLEEMGDIENGTYFVYLAMDEGIAYTSAVDKSGIHTISSDFLPLATPTAAGAMKQAAAVANVTAAPTAEEFNALLKSLRDAGILATS